MINVNEFLFQRFTFFFYKKAATSVDKSAANTSGGAIKSKI